MPPAWKTNGSGQIVASPDLSGKWLALQAFATYKLAAPPTLPERFTVEFDIVPVGDTLRDAGDVTFGFAADNSVQSYIQDAYNDGAITAVELNFAGDSRTEEHTSDLQSLMRISYAVFCLKKK